MTSINYQKVCSFIVFTCCCTFISTSSEDRSKWQCVNNEYCQRVSDLKEKKYGVTYPKIEICRLICGINGPLWPRPKEVKFNSKELFVFSQKNIRVDYSANGPARSVLEEMISLFKSRISVDSFGCDDKNLIVYINVTLDSTTINWQTDENYHLSSNLVDNTLKVFINAQTIFGARHGLESLNQLIEPYPINANNSCLATIQNVVLNDGPTYPHRGLLLDSSRNFLSIPTIRKQLDAMSASKMNQLHWHLTDSQSFPFESPRVPNMTKYGTILFENYYKYLEVKELIHYAKVRGIRIVFELDAPSHAGYGWQWGPEAGLGNLTVCLNEQHWSSFCSEPPCGQMNPANQKIYDVLEELYKDFQDLTPDSDVFHMGGDEVNINCWNSTEEIVNYLGDRPRTLETFLDLWSEFQSKATERFDVAQKNTSIILWTSDLTNPNIIEKYLDKNRYVIQTWVQANDQLPDVLLKKGYRLIISTKDRWYLDHGFWGNTKYYNWRTVYQNKIPTTSSGVLGGEVCMWSEYVDDNAIDGRIWPRAAAAAERLWWNPVQLYSEATIRFYRHRERLVSLGVQAEAVIPKWCYLDEGFCF